MQVEIAREILDVAMEAQVLGYIPEADNEKIEMAVQFIKMAHQQKTVADAIGHENVPLIGSLLKIIELGEKAAEADATAESQENMNAFLGENEAVVASAEQAIADLPTQAAEEPTSVYTTNGQPKKGEWWADQQGEVWQVREDADGPEVEVTSYKTMELTDVPRSFLISRTEEPARSNYVKIL